MSENEVVIFEQQNLAVFQKMHDLKVAKDEIEKQEKALREQLEKSMYDYNVKTFKNELVTISYIDESTTTSIDLKALEKKEPELYKELLEDYPKTTTKKASVRILVK